MSESRDAVNQSLSSLLDDEHTELDLRRVLKAMESDETVLETWNHYSHSRQLLRKETTHVCNSDFLSSVQAAIAEEDAVVAKSGSSKSSNAKMFDWFARAGVAACFTFAFLLGFNYLSTEQSAEQPASFAATELAASVPDGFELPPLNARTVSSGAGTNFRDPLLYSRPAAAPSRAVQQSVRVSPELQAYLDELMLKHAELSSSNGSFGIMPLSRVNAVEAEAKP